jgi:hypothetical protein
MKKVISKIIYYFNPNYFEKCSYSRLDKWGIEDCFEGKLIFID